MKAFPVFFQVDGLDGKPAQVVDQGMDLRDYFAAKIMQSLVQNYQDDPGWNAYEQSYVAYQIADAMMQERE